MNDFSMIDIQCKLYKRSMSTCQLKLHDLINISHFAHNVKHQPCPMRCEPEGATYFHPEMSLSPGIC